MNHAEILRAATQDINNEYREEMRQAADYIEQLEAANAILLRKTELYECPWCGFYGTPSGHGPEDPPMPATLRDKVTDAIATVLLQQPPDLLPVNERPYLERTELAQQEFNDRTRHGW